MEKEIIIDGLYYLSIKDKQIKFTTDNPYWKNIQLEEILEKLFKSFEISEFTIFMHHHPGKIHDKDILIKLKEEQEIIKISDYILNEFYDKK